MQLFPFLLEFPRWFKALQRVSPLCCTVSEVSACLQLVVIKEEISFGVPQMKTNVFFKNFSVLNESSKMQCFIQNGFFRI